MPMLAARDWIEVHAMFSGILWFANETMPRYILRGFTKQSSVIKYISGFVITEENFMLNSFIFSKLFFPEIQ